MLMQEFKVIGRIGKVGELKPIPEKELVVAEFSVASQGFYDKENQVTETHWLNFAAFNKDAEKVVNNLEPGDIVEVKFQIVNDVQKVGGKNVHGYKLRLLDIGFVWLKKWANNGN